MYHLALYIDNRKYHIGQLRGAAENTANGPIPSFVLERAIGQNRPLLSIATQAKLIFHGGFGQDQLIDWTSVRPEQTTQGVRLHLKALAPTEKPANKAIPKASEPTVSDGMFQVRFQGNRCVLEVNSASCPDQVSVTLAVDVEGTTYEQCLQLHLVAKAHIHDIVLDFGSEASQLVISKRNSDGLFRLNLVDTLLKYYYPTLGGKALHQRISDDAKPSENGIKTEESAASSEDQELYRSAFFVRRKKAVFLPDAPPGTHREEEFLNLLTNRSEINTLVAERELVSNLKLAHLGAYDFTVEFKEATQNSFGVKEKKFFDTLPALQQAVVDYFLQAAIQTIHEQTAENEPVYVVVKLLMPNVFEQRKITRMLYGVIHYLGSLVAKANYRLNGFEISTVSESDAAFLGFKREREKASRQGNANLLKTGAHYLIIDVGKGTTDFSIVHIDKTGELTSKYRSGFIGAGNVLSYAFIDTVFAALCGPNAETRQKAIFSVMDRVGIADKLRFTELIDKLKRAYKPGATYKPLQEFARFTTVKDLVSDPDDPSVLEALTSLLADVASQQESILDEYDIIKESVKKTANQIFHTVYYSGFFVAPDKPDKSLIDRIILTGRGFKFEPLRQAVGHVFRMHGYNIAIEQADELKKVSLSGSFSSDHINFESNLVGVPDVRWLFDSPGLHMPNMPAINVIDQGNGHQVPVPKLNSLQTIASSYHQIKSIWDKLKEDANKAATLSPENGPAPTSQAALPDEGLQGEERFVLEGKTFINFNRRKQNITICGVDYRDHSIDSPQVNIYYTGETFLIRSEQACSELGIERDFVKQSQWVSRTLFPFARLTRWQDVQVELLEQDAF
jgi:hypothetical protein